MAANIRAIHFGLFHTLHSIHLPKLTHHPYWILLTIPTHASYSQLCRFLSTDSISSLHAMATNLLLSLAFPKAYPLPDPKTTTYTYSPTLPQLMLNHTAILSAIRRS